MTPQTIKVNVDLMPCMRTTTALDNLIARCQAQIHQEMRSNSDPKIIVFRLVWELADVTRFLDRFQNCISQMKFDFPDCKIFLICHNWYESSCLHARLHGIDDTLYIDMCALRVYHKLIVNQQSPIVEHWDSTNHKVLFLTGKACKINRIRLLYKLLKSDLATVLNWSLIIKPEEIAACKSFLPDVHDHDFEWLLSQQRQSDSFFSATGIPYQSEIYSTAQFQIVSETDFDRLFIHPVISEKIWLSILNHRPFIIAGEFKALDLLASMGFYTFQEFLVVPNYDNPDKTDFLEYGPLAELQGPFLTENQINDWQNFYNTMKDAAWPDIQHPARIDLLPPDIAKEIRDAHLPSIEDINEMRLAAIVENALWWQKNIQHYQSEIWAMLKHNHDRFVSLGQQNCLSLTEFFERNGIDMTFEDIIETEGLA